MNEPLQALSRGQISFDEFARRTSGDWDRLSAKLYNRWRRAIPLGVTQLDVRQEMLLNAWKALSTFDPTRGTTLKGHVVFSACSKALRMLHVQRRAKRFDDHAESRHPISFAELGEATAEWLQALLYEEADDVGARMDAVRGFYALLSESEGLEKCALLAVRDAAGDTTEAAERLYNELPPRFRLSLKWDELKCRRFVEQTFAAAAARLMEAADGSAQA